MITKRSVYVTDNTDPYKNLAMEEYLTLHVQPGECILFLWQNRRTVVIGKNQNCWRECKVNYLEADGGRLVRRLSGGGAVFHDLGNLNFTFCVRREDYDVGRQSEVILQAVRMLGIKAERTGRNDITAGGRKFSGNAFYRAKDCCYHHGTLLVDVDKEAMARYLNVSREKLQAKSVSSVRSRVVNLKELDPELTVAQLREKMIRAFEQVYEGAAEAVPKSRFDWAEVERYERRFASWDWKYGRKLPFQYSMYRRFPWGDVELQFQVDGGVVRGVNVFSDGMEQEFIAALPKLWEGCRYDEASLCGALQAAAERAAETAGAGCMDGAEARAAGAARMAEDIQGMIRESI